MAKMWDVTSFEVTRTLKKKSFWYSAVAIPLIIIAVYGVSYISDKQAANKARKQPIPASAKMAAYDSSGLISASVLKAQKVTVEPSQEAGIEAVKNNQLDAFFYYPPKVVTAGISVYEKDGGLTNTPPYSALAQSILKASAGQKVLKTVHNQDIVVVLGQTTNVTETTYKNGAETHGIAALIAPGILMIAFLMLIVLLMYLMISATTEEKENRVAEILLTSIKGRTLILGKILSIFVLGIVQLIILVVPLVILYLKFKGSITLPGGVSLSQVPIDPTQIGLGVAGLILGLVMFTGLLVGLGSLFPSAQEAGRFVGVMVIWAFLPIYTVGYIISSPDAAIVKIFTYFPLTSPTTLLLRNALGSITVAQALPALLILAVCGVLAIMFAVRAFQMSAMEYGRRVSIKEILR